MAVKVFDSVGAAQDELAGIRKILSSNGIRYYETTPEFQGEGYSEGGLWILDHDEAGKARALIEEYEKEYTNRHKSDVGEQIGYTNTTPAITRLFITLKYIIRNHRHSFSFKVLTVIFIITVIYMTVLIGKVL